MRVLTAAEARTSTVAAARGLVALGLRRGDRFAIVTPELEPSDAAPDGQVATLAVVSAALRLGITPVMLHPLLTASERALIVADSGASHLLDGAAALSDLLATGGPAPELAPAPLGRPMHYTSGTSGRPKGVVAHLSKRQAADYWAAETAHWGFDGGDVMLLHSPLAHSAPLRLALCALEAGGSVIAAGRFEPDRFARILHEHHPTTAFVVPTQLQLLLQQPDRLPPSPYRKLIHAGSACPAPLKRSIHAWAGAERVVEFYGSTEGHFTTCPGAVWERHPGTVGRARSDRSIATDDDGRVWCTVPDYARFEYHGDPGKTEAAWRETSSGPRFTVGDIGRLDDDGYLYLEGRREDLIISGGMNVYPAEVEAAILQHCRVTDVVVHAVDHERWGQAVCATVVSQESPAVLRAALAGRLASYKIPKEWRIVSAIPRNSMGKVERSRLSG